MKLNINISDHPQNEIAQELEGNKVVYPTTLHK